MPKPPRLPPPKIATRQMLQESSPPPPPQNNEAAVRESLEKTRAALQVLVLEYKELLQKTQLASNRSTEENRARHKLIVDMHDLASQLEFVNAGEGLMTLCVTALHSTLVIKDEINDVKFQNAVLNKRFKSAVERADAEK